MSAFPYCFARVDFRRIWRIDSQGRTLIYLSIIDFFYIYTSQNNFTWTHIFCQTFKDVVSVDLAMASNRGSSNKRNTNRGFAFVRFSSHAVSLCLTGGKVFLFLVHSAFAINLNIVLRCSDFFLIFCSFYPISLNFPFGKVVFV